MMNLSGQINYEHEQRQMSGGFGCFFGLPCCNTSEIVPIAPRDFTIMLDSRTNEELSKRYM